MGNGDGLLNYIENTGTATAPAFVQRTGSANPFDGIDVGSSSKPTLGDSDDTLNYLENTGTSTALAFVQRTGSANPFDGIDVGWVSAPALADLDADGTLRPRPSIG